MKKILVVVCAVAFCLAAASADAQVTPVPYVQVYFDEFHTVTVLEECPTAPAGTLYVVAHNWNMWMSAIEYRIEYPPEVGFLGDSIDEDRQLAIGQSPTGIAIAWKNTPGKAFVSLRLQTVSVLWNCEDCQTQNVTITVVKSPDSDPTQPNHLVRALDWPDEAEHWGFGMAAYLCAIVPVEETTWGGIKAQYDR
jgi:hypothetical protein